MVCCGLIVCWTPNQIYFFLNFVGHAIDFSGWFYHFIQNYPNNCIYSTEEYLHLSTFSVLI